MPSIEAATALAVPALPPLYQALYDVPVLDAARGDQQRVRLLVWLRHMDLSTAQLDALDELRGLALERHARIQAAEAELTATLAAEEQIIYEDIWTALTTGTPVDDAALSDLSQRLVSARHSANGSDRRADALALRLEGVRAIIEAERPFLQSLSQVQEALLADAVFLLRRRLDPVASPGDFRAMVGSTYEAGEFGALRRGGGAWADQPLNIGGLWADQPPLEGGALYDAQREVVLFLTVLEPGLEEAIAAAREQAAVQAP